MVEDKIPPYIRGYIEGLINAQCNVYGYNFISDSLSDDMVQKIMSVFGMTIKPDYIECDRDVVADYYIGHKCTERDRILTLRAVSNRFNLDLYTTSDPADVPNAHFRGIADSITMLPKIFKCSKINLDIVHKSIQSTQTVRTYDAMGLGGFVISNYQLEIPEYFTIDKDIVVYESIPDLLNKIEYYLSHDDERMQIAKNGQAKVLANHTYDIRAAKILDTLKNHGIH
ncbi:MAG: glycosyltransferase [Clostridium sp.]|nr:glycosyltransferase [Clostridium sp.]MCM1207429.1 glycosyltransferase [Ruminococcus sp.]